MKQNLTVLYPMSAYYPSQVGGPANSVYWICEGLKKSKNIQTSVVSTTVGINKKDIDLNEWITNGNNEVLFIESKGMLPIKLILKSIAQIKNSDIIHLNSFFHSPSLIIAIINSLFYKKKIIVSVRGELYPYALNNFRPQLKKVFIYLWRFFIKNVVIHCTVEKEKKYTLDIFKEKANIVLLPNYILRPDLENIVKKHSKDYILFLGRLHKIKGLENLIKSLKISQAFINSTTVLKLAGKGESEYVNKLEKLVKALGLEDKVEFLGQVEGKQKEELIANAYFLLLPSYTENFGNVVVEALLHGTPVVASKGTPWSILDSENAGFWVENSVDILAKAVDKIYNLSDEEYYLLSDNAKKIAFQEFDIKTNYKKWEDVYFKLHNN